MTEEERLAICETCANRMLSVCTLTGKVPEFEKECPDYEKKVIIDKQEIEKKEEKECVEIGRKTTLALLWIFVVLFIEIGLFYAVYHGINWARKLLSYLIIISPFSGMVVDSGSSLKPPLLL